MLQRSISISNHSLHTNLRKSCQNLHCVRNPARRPAAAQDDDAWAPSTSSYSNPLLNGAAHYQSHGTLQHSTSLHQGRETATVRRPKYERVMLKVSGEALAGNQGFGLDPTVLEGIAAEVVKVTQHGVRVAVVVGGGNFFR